MRQIGEHSIDVVYEGKSIDFDAIDFFTREVWVDTSIIELEGVIGAIPFEECEIIITKTPHAEDKSE